MNLENFKSVLYAHLKLLLTASLIMKHGRVDEHNINFWRVSELRISEREPPKNCFQYFK